MTRYLALGLVGIASAGCIFVSSNKGYHTPPPPPAQVVYVHVPAGATTQQAVAADFQARIDAAGSIVSIVERDEVLAKIAKDAADYGDADMTRAALAGIASFTTRDDACASACVSLTQRGHRAEAIEIARTMAQFTQRDATLKKLAMN